MIAAAGSGKRLGAGGPKALVELAGRPLLSYLLDACREAARVAEVIVAAPPGREPDLESLLVNAELSSEAAVVTGGSTRAKSVRNALAIVKWQSVVIHDAARPLVTASLLDAVLERLESRPDATAVIVAAPLTDTVKRAREPRPGGGGEVARGGPTVAETLSREHLWAAQTPQAFRTEALREAQESVTDAAALGALTDEAMLIERAGGKVLIHESPGPNIKVTSASDLELAEALLAAR